MAFAALAGGAVGTHFDSFAVVDIVVVGASVDLVEVQLQALDVARR